LTATLLLCQLRQEQASEHGRGKHESFPYSTVPTTDSTHLNTALQ